MVDVAAVVDTVPIEISSEFGSVALASSLVASSLHRSTSAGSDIVASIDLASLENTHTATQPATVHHDQNRSDWNRNLVLNYLNLLILRFRSLLFLVS